MHFHGRHGIHTISSLSNQHAMLLLHHALLHLHLHWVAHVSGHVVVAAVMHWAWSAAAVAHVHHVSRRLDGGQSGSSLWDPFDEVLCCVWEKSVNIYFR